MPTAVIILAAGHPDELRPPQGPPPPRLRPPPRPRPRHRPRAGARTHRPRHRPRRARGHRRRPRHRSRPPNRRATTAAWHRPRRPAGRPRARRLRRRSGGAVCRQPVDPTRDAATPARARAAGDAAWRARLPARRSRTLRPRGHRRATATRAIVEWIDAAAPERAQTLCNAGVLWPPPPTGALARRGTRRQCQGGILSHRCRRPGACRGRRAAAVEAPADDAGINSRGELAAAEAVVQSCARADAMDGGVTMTSVVGLPVRRHRARPDVRSSPTWSSVRASRSRPAQHPRVQPPRGLHCRPRRCIGPFARLRPGAELDEEVHVGNFVEVKEATTRRAAPRRTTWPISATREIGAGDEHRRRDDHLQLRRLQQASHRRSARAHSSAPTPRWLRR